MRAFRRRTLYAVFAVVAIASVALAACDGEDGTSAGDGTPVLRNSPIPTVVIEPSPTPVCDPPAAAELPANFPPDVTVPPDYKVDVVETTPHLRVVGRVMPPMEIGGSAYGIVHDALLRSLIEDGWQTERSASGDGAFVTFSMEDGRTGTYHSLPVVGCVEEVQLTYELTWVTE